MKILIDAMGSDRAPLPEIEGCLAARKRFGADIALVGNTSEIMRCADMHRLDLSQVEILHAEQVVSMDDDPLVVRSRPDTSLRVGLSILREGMADAFISAGNTGALQLGANLFVRPIEGIERLAIGAILPAKNPVLLLDCGANTTFTPHVLLVYAVMGSIYMEKMHGVLPARVGLLNIGKEECKGTPAHRTAYELLSATDLIAFVGNVEPADVFDGKCDVVISDGFSGNIFLKTMESVGKLLLSKVSTALESHAKQSEASPLLHHIADRFDPSIYGGAPLIGISAPVIKAHGNSDGIAIQNAVGQAIRYTQSHVIDEIKNRLSEIQHIL